MGEPCWSSYLALRTTTYRLTQPPPTILGGGGGALLVIISCPEDNHTPSRTAITYHPQRRGEPCWSSCLALRTTTYRLVQPHLPSEEEGRGTQLVIMSCPEVSHSPHLPSSEGGGGCWSSCLALRTATYRLAQPPLTLLSGGWEPCWSSCLALRAATYLNACRHPVASQTCGHNAPKGPETRKEWPQTNPLTPEGRDGEKRQLGLRVASRKAGCCAPIPASGWALLGCSG